MLKPLVLNPSNAEATFVLSTRTQWFENHLNHVMLVFIFATFYIGQISHSSIRVKSYFWNCCLDRARHWCLPHCPGQVEFVNYSCGASENCILLAPLGKYVFYISGLFLRMCASFVVCHPRKYAFTWQNHVLLGFKWNIIKLLYTVFQEQVKVGVGQVKIESYLPYGASRCKS